MLFDCDGVLVESDASVAAAWSRWAVKYGFDPAIVGDIVHGRRASDTVTLLIDPERHDPAQALADINAYEVEGAATVTAIPGAVALTGAIEARPLGGGHLRQPDPGDGPAGCGRHPERRRAW